MALPNIALRQAVAHLLADEAGESRTSEDLAIATARVYERFAHRLAPLVGAIGVEAIFTRSVNLTKVEFSFFPEDPAARPDETLPTEFMAALKEQEPATSRKAAEALLTAFAALLMNLIGERLTWLLLFDRPKGLSERPRQERTG